MILHKPRIEWGGGNERLTFNELGNNDTSLALAFGMWYMIIPHISIVSGLLLAGNNPNTLEGVVAHEFGDTDPRFPDQRHLGTLAQRSSNLLTTVGIDLNGSGFGDEVNGIGLRR